GIIAESAPDRPEQVESLPQAEDHAAVRLRSTQPRSTGRGHLEGSVPEDLVDAAVVKTRAARDRGRMTGPRREVRLAGARRRNREPYVTGVHAPQHFLYFLPLPHGHGSFLPVFGVALLISEAVL